MTLTLLHAGRQTSGAPAFSPLDLPGLVGWWDPSLLALSNGANVTTLEDQSANGNDLAAGTAPTFLASGINGLGSLTMGPGTLYKASMVDYGTNHHIFAVVRATTWEYKDLLGSGTSAGDILVQTDSSKKPKSYYWATGADMEVLGGTAMTDDTPYIIEHILTATQLKSKSTPDGTEGAVASAGTRPTGLKQFVLGGRASGSPSFVGTIGEVILCAGTDLAAGERADAITYLTDKWLTPSTSNAGMAIGLMGLTYSA
jgi:hypothetical protein